MRRVHELTAKEFGVIAYFFANVGRAVSRDLLAKLAWGRELDSTSRTVDIHIYRLRRKLSLHPENGVRLSAVYTHGYKLDELVSINGKWGVSTLPTPEECVMQDPALMLV